VIEARTAELMLTALPVLRRITGERIQNELTLILREMHAGRALLKLEALGIARAIHPAFTIQPSLMEAIATLHGDHPRWSDDQLTILWHLMMAGVPADQVYEVCRRLLLSETHSAAIQQSASLYQKPGILADPTSSPSDIDALLTSASDETLLAVWVLTDQAQVRQHLEQYCTSWKQIRPHANGNTLINMGLPPGPHFRHILEHLRKAWLDGQLHTAEQEQAYLNTLIAEVRDGKS
jgi:tRNA nucleotidyltransferase (CCA-adding enzyme)